MPHLRHNLNPESSYESEDNNSFVPHLIGINHNKIQSITEPPV